MDTDMDMDMDTDMNKRSQPEALPKSLTGTMCSFTDTDTDTGTDTGTNTDTDTETDTDMDTAWIWMGKDMDTDTDMDTMYTNSHLDGVPKTLTGTLRSSTEPTVSTWRLGNPAMGMIVSGGSSGLKHSPGSMEKTATLRRAPINHTYEGGGGGGRGGELQHLFHSISNQYVHKKIVEPDPKRCCIDIITLQRRVGEAPVVPGDIFLRVPRLSRYIILDASRRGKKGDKTCPDKNVKQGTNPSGERGEEESLPCDPPGYG